MVDKRCGRMRTWLPISKAVVRGLFHRLGVASTRCKAGGEAVHQGHDRTWCWADLSDRGRGWTRGRCRRAPTASKEEHQEDAKYLHVMKVLDRWAVYYPKERRATSAPLLTTHKKAAVSRTDWAVFVLGICLRNSCSTTELHRRRRGIVAERRVAMPNPPSVVFLQHPCYCTNTTARRAGQSRRASWLSSGFRSLSFLSLCC